MAIFSSAAKRLAIKVPIDVIMRDKYHIDMVMIVKGMLARVTMTNIGKVRYNIAGSSSLAKAISTYLQNHMNELPKLFTDDECFEDFKKKLYTYLKVML